MDEKQRNIDPIYEPDNHSFQESEYRTYRPIQTQDTNTNSSAMPEQDITLGGEEYDSNSPRINQSPYERGKEHSPKKKHGFFRFVALFVVFVFLGGVVFGAGYGTAIYLGNRLTPALVEEGQTLSFNVNKIEPVVSADTTVATSNNLITSIAKTAGPAVVTVTSTFEINTRSFFSNSIYEQEGTGSGIIYELRNEDLLIVTNHHVIDSAKKVDVTFHDGNTLSADLIGYDSRMDLAVLSIELSDLDASEVEDITIANYGDSEALEVGELAVAIGNPLGKEFSSTVTAGVISAIDRELNIDGSNLTLLQTDAAINPGNSGGALVNSKGEVIGINTAKYVDESVEGMGFSIPTHIALPIIDAIVDSGNGEDIAYSISGDKPFLGVSISNITDEIYNETGMPSGFM